MCYRWIILLLIAALRIPDEQPVLTDPEPVLTDLPAVAVVYDPSLPERYPEEPMLRRNCDDDCSTVATGALEDWMYETAGACDGSLLGRTVYFPLIDLTHHCVDTGGDIKAHWSPHHDRTVLYFDVLWHLEWDAEERRILGAPEWNYWLLEDWTIIH